MVNLIISCGTESNFQDLLPMLYLVERAGMKKDDVWPTLILDDDLMENSWKLISDASHLYEKISITRTIISAFQRGQNSGTYLCQIEEIRKCISSKRPFIHLRIEHSFLEEPALFELAKLICSLKIITMVFYACTFNSLAGLTNVALEIQKSEIQYLIFDESSITCQECHVITSALSKSRVKWLNLHVKDFGVNDDDFVTMMRLLTHTNVEFLSCYWDNITSNAIDQIISENLLRKYRRICLHGHLIDEDRKEMMIETCKALDITLIIGMSKRLRIADPFFNN